MDDKKQGIIWSITSVANESLSINPLCLAIQRTLGTNNFCYLYLLELELLKKINCRSTINGLLLAESRLNIKNIFDFTESRMA